MLYTERETNVRAAPDLRITIKGTLIPGLADLPFAGFCIEARNGSKSGG